MPWLGVLNEDNTQQAALPIEPSALRITSDAHDAGRLSLLASVSDILDPEYHKQQSKQHMSGL